MNVLVYSSVPIWERHHLESVEIAALHLERGDSVWFWSCVGALSSCLANPRHDGLSCTSCRSFTKKTRHLKAMQRATMVDLQLPRLPPSFSESIQVSFSSIADFEYGGAPIGRLALAQLIDEQRDSFCSDELVQTRGKQLIELGCSLLDAATQLISEQGIDAVYAFNGRHVSEGPVLWAAKLLGRQTISHDSSSPSEKIFLVEDTSVHSYIETYASGRSFLEQHQQAITDEVTDEGTRFFSNQEFGTDPYFGFVHFASGTHSRTPNRSSDRPLLVIFTSSDWEFASLPDYRPVNSEFKDQYDAYKKILTDPRILSEWEVWVRWHPNLMSAGPNETSRVRRTVEACGDVRHILPNDPLNSYAILEEADVVLGWGSSILAEATFRGKPAISLAPTQFDAFRLTHKVDNLEQLIDLLGQRPRPRDRRRAIVYGYWMRTAGSITFSRCLPGPGGAILVAGERYAVWWAPIRRLPLYSSSASLMRKALRQCRRFVGAFHWARN